MKDNSWNLWTECPQCKLWGANIEKLENCPECGLKFSSRIKEKMIDKALLEDVIHFVFNGFFGSLCRVIEAWKEEHTVFTEEEIRFGEILKKLLNPENEYSAKDFYLNKRG
nr:MAG: Zn finger protein [uncultured archaeon]